MDLHHINRAPLGFIDVFPNETPEDKSFYINKIGTQTIYQFCTYFLGRWRVDKYLDIESFLKEWFTYNSNFNYTQSPSYYVVETEVRRLQRKDPNIALQLIVPEAILNLFLWIRNNPGLPEQGTDKDASVTLQLLRLLLLFNQEVNANNNKAKASVSKYNDHLKPYRELLATQFPQWDLNITDYAQLFFTQILKLAILLDFLANTPEYQALHAHLLKEFGCANNKDYLQGVATLPASRLSAPPGKTTINVPPGVNYNKDVAFLEKIAIQPEQVLSSLQNDFLSLRSAPLIKIKAGTYDILFDPFLLKKIYTGLTFLLSSWCPPGNSLFKGDFLGAFKEDFSEEHLMYSVLSKIYKAPTDVLITGKKFKAINLPREPDMYIRRDKKILLFESKDVFMPGAEKLSYDFDTIEGGLKKDGRFGKAVKQLATNVGRALKKELILDTTYNENEVEIFPILVVHDSLYSCPLFNFWVNQWFQQELATLQASPYFAGVDFSRVIPLTVIEIDSLILYQQSLSDGNLDLPDLIKQYHAQVESARTYSSQKDCLAHALQQLSFSEAIRAIAHERGIEIDMTESDSALKKIGLS